MISIIIILWQLYDAFIVFNITKVLKLIIFLLWFQLR